MQDFPDAQHRTLALHFHIPHDQMLGVDLREILATRGYLVAKYLLWNGMHLEEEQQPVLVGDPELYGQQRRRMKHRGR
jgi:hypothetical protein